MDREAKAVFNIFSEIVECKLCKERNSVGSGNLHIDHRLTQERKWLDSFNSGGWDISKILVLHIHGTRYSRKAYLQLPETQTDLRCI